MNRRDTAIKGSAIGIMSQIVSLVAKFIVRTFAIRILGKEILGLDGVLIDTINMLSLAEMGVTSAMLFRLYAPVISNDQARINEWMASYRKIYQIIAATVACLGIAISFALPAIIKNISVSWTEIYIAFYLQLACSVSSYLLAYQRILLNADQKKHLCMLADLVMNVVFSIAKVAVIVVFRSYLIYLVIAILQTISSNLAIHLYAKKLYPFIKNKVRSKKEDLAVIIGDTKEVLANKIAAYVYTSTDNLIISVFIGTGTVGVLSNYKYISTALRSLVNSAMAAIQPLIGNYLNSDTAKDDSFRTLKRYTFIRYIIAGATTVPFITLADTFVSIWTKDSSYLLPYSITILLALDYYIGCIYGPLGEYILGMGMFKAGKYATFAGAIVNLSLSLLGVWFWGINGVLLATVISQLVICAGDIIIILFKYYEDRPTFKWGYFRLQAELFLMLCVSTVISILSLRLVSNGNAWFAFVIGGIISELVFFSMVLIAKRKSDEFEYAKAMCLKLFYKLKK